MRLKIERTPALIAEVIEHAREAVQQADRAPISVEIADASLTVLGSPHDLVRLFSNLLEKGGEIRRSRPGAAKYRFLRPRFGTSDIEV